MRSLTQQLQAGRSSRRETAELGDGPSLQGNATLAYSVRQVWEQQLLTAQAANTNGTWVNIERVYPVSVQISGITDATVQVRVSAQPTSPAAADHQTQAGLDVTADGMVTLEYPVRWLKLRVLNYVAGSINGYGWGLKTFA